MYNNSTGYIKYPLWYRRGEDIIPGRFLDQVWRYNTRMDPEIDIIMSAKVLIDQHGEKAAEIATQGEYEMLERGDEKGATIWNKIIAAIFEQAESVFVCKNA